MGEIWRNKGKYERLGKPLQERARLNTISWDFPRGEIILGVLEMPCTSQKTATRATQLAQRLEKKTKTQKPIKTECLPSRVLWRHMKGIWEKYGEIRKNERLGKPLQERARLNTISWYFSRGEIILGVLKMPCTSQKTATRATQLAQRLGKIQKPAKPNACPFPLIPTVFFDRTHERNMGEIGRSMKK